MARVRFDEKLVKIAKFSAIARGCTISHQIEYWAKIGRIVEENSERRYRAIEGTLRGGENFKIDWPFTQSRRRPNIFHLDKKRSIVLV